jgi:predicted methyltransferase
MDRTPEYKANLFGVLLLGVRIRGSWVMLGEAKMKPDNISSVDHFPDLLKHFDENRLLGITRHYIRLADAGSEVASQHLAQRAEICLQECKRRAIGLDNVARVKQRSNTIKPRRAA